MQQVGDDTSFSIPSFKHWLKAQEFNDTELSPNDYNILTRRKGSLRMWQWIMSNILPLDTISTMRSTLKRINDEKNKALLSELRHKVDTLHIQLQSIDNECSKLESKCRQVSREIATSDIKTHCINSFILDRDEKEFNDLLERINQIINTRNVNGSTSIPPIKLLPKTPRVFSYKKIISDFYTIESKENTQPVSIEKLRQYEAELNVAASIHQELNTDILDTIQRIKAVFTLHEQTVLPSTNNLCINTPVLLSPSNNITSVTRRNIAVAIDETLLQQTLDIIETFNNDHNAIVSLKSALEERLEMISNDDNTIVSTCSHLKTEALGALARARDRTFETARNCYI